jgi:hypothetical protein
MEIFRSQEWLTHPCRCHVCGVLLPVEALLGWATSAKPFTASSLAVIANEGTAHSCIEPGRDGLGVEIQLPGSVGRWNAHGAQNFR